MRKTVFVFVTLLFVISSSVLAREPELKNELRPKLATAPAVVSKEIRAEMKERVQELKSKIWGTVAKFEGTVKSVTANTLVVTTDGKDVIINITDKTKLFRKYWGKASIDEIVANDKVYVLGKWVDGTKTAVNALTIRDESIQKVHGTFIGKVLSVNDTGWVIQTVERGSLTVTVGTVIKYVNRKEETIRKSDVLVGHRIRVKGLWNKANNTITEATHVKDYDLPTRLVTPTVTPI